jgi:hypothetical protein
MASFGGRGRGRGEGGSGGLASSFEGLRVEADDNLRGAVDEAIDDVMEKPP